MISKSLEHPGLQIKISSVLMLFLQLKPNQNIGNPWQNQYSLQAGTSAVSTQHQNTEEQSMVPSFQEFMLQTVSPKK